jgi:cytochrome oxidase assembly protein ShyY1
VLRTLRQPRYAALGVLMVLVAIGCVAAGTWQIARFEQKGHDNHALRANAHRSAVAVADVLPLVGSGRTPARDDIEFRTVTARGTYDVAVQSLVRDRTVGGDLGYLVLTPLRTARGTLLVVRGFIAWTASGGVPSPAPPPGGTVTITARTYSAESWHDAATQLTHHQVVESINPADQAARLGGAVYNGFAELETRRPGTHGLVAMPEPDLSNPAGGALEPQHFAYIIQWYLFAALALAAPFVMARAETKVRRTVEINSGTQATEPAATESAAKPSDAELRTAKLSDRHGHVR